MKRIGNITVSFTFLCVLFLVGCSELLLMPPEMAKQTSEAESPLYIIGPGDAVSVFVWGNPDLSAKVPVRPDGRITTPLVEDVQASGKTSSQLAREMERQLARYVKNPVVTVYVDRFVGRYTEQIRIIGEAAKITSIPYKQNMTLLDVMIAVGGLTKFADGDGASIVRSVDGGPQQQFLVRLGSLVKNGDISANVSMMPGDILIIPEAWF